MRKQIQLGNNGRGEVNSLQHAKAVAAYTGTNWFVYFEGDKVTGYSRPGKGARWIAEEL